MFVADLIRQRCYKAEVTPYQGDHGIDIMAYAPNGEREVIQCKKYFGQVGEPVVRDFYGAMLHANAVRGWIFTTGVFTPQAVEWAQGKPIELVNGEQLVKLAGSTIPLDYRQISQSSSMSNVAEKPVVPTSVNPPLCPVHGIPMIVQTAQRGSRRGKQFYGCPKFPKCREIINIDP